MKSRSKAGPSRPPRATALRTDAVRAGASRRGAKQTSPSAVPSLVGHVPLAEAKRRFVKKYLEELLTACDWSIRKAAMFAGVERSNFKRLMDEHSVPREQPLSAESARLLANGMRDTRENFVSAVDLDDISRRTLRANAPRMEHVTRKELERRRKDVGHPEDAANIDAQLREMATEDDGRCHAASQRSDGECHWELCPVKGGTGCPRMKPELPEENGC